MKVTAEHAECECVAARINMKERFLLNRVALKRPDVAEGDLELTILHEADFADPAAAFGQQTAVPAGHAADTILLRVPQRAGRGVVIQNVSLNFIGDLQFHDGSWAKLLLGNVKAISMIILLRSHLERYIANNRVVVQFAGNGSENRRASVDDGRVAD